MLAAAASLFFFACAAPAETEETELTSNAVTADGAITPSDTKGYMELIKPAFEAAIGSSFAGVAPKTDCDTVPGWSLSYNKYFSYFNHECRTGLKAPGLRPSIDIIYLAYSTPQTSRYVFFDGSTVVGEVWDSQPAQWFYKDTKKMVPYVEAATAETIAAPASRAQLAGVARAAFEALPNEALVAGPCTEKHGPAQSGPKTICYTNILDLDGAGTRARIVRVGDPSGPFYFVLAVEAPNVPTTAIAEARAASADGSFEWFLLDADGVASKI